MEPTTEDAVDPLRDAWLAAQPQRPDPLKTAWEAAQHPSLPPGTPVSTRPRLAPVDATRILPGPANPGARPLTGIPFRIAKNVVDPMLESPISTAMLMGPVWPVGLALTAKNIAEQFGGYAGQKAAEVTADPATRKIMESDPERIEGADVGTQAAALAILPLLHAGVKEVLPDVGPGMAEGMADFAKESKGTPPIDPEIKSAMFAQRFQAMGPLQAAWDDAQKTRQFAETLSEPVNAKAVAKATPAVEGLQTPTAAVEDIASEKIAGQVSDQVKAEQAAEQDRLASEAKAKADYDATLGTRTPLGIEKGIVRRPKGSPLEEAYRAAQEPPVSAPTVEEAPPATPAIEPNPVELPKFPEGSAMGGLEGRIPAVTAARLPNAEPQQGAMVMRDQAALLAGEPPPPRGGTVVPSAPPIEMPPGIPKGVGPESLLNRSKFQQRNQAVLDQELARLSEQGLDKTKVTFAEQHGLARAFADALGIDRLQLDPKARLSGAEIVGVKEHATAIMDEMEATSKELAQGRLSAEEAETLETHLDNLRAENDQLLSHVVRGSEEAARDLGFLRQMAAHTLDPDTFVLEAKRRAGDMILSDKTIADIRRLAREAQEVCG